MKRSKKTANAVGRAMKKVHPRGPMPNDKHRATKHPRKKGRSKLVRD